MKRYNKVFVLLAVLAIISIATFALTRFQEEQERIKSTDEVILQVPADRVTALAWDYGEDAALSFRKGEDGWQYDGDTAFPVSEAKIVEILGHFEKLAATFIIEDVTDYSQYGMDAPECTLTVTADTQTYTIMLGTFSQMDQQRYIDIGDGNVYLVAEDPAEYLSSSVSDLILHDDTPGFETVVDITFTGNRNYTITRVDGSTDTYNSDSDIYFMEVDGKTVPLDTSLVKQYLNTVTGLGLLDFVTYNATQEELEAYGLAEPELSVTVNYTYTDENEETVADTCVFHLGRNVEEQAANDAAVAAGESGNSVVKYIRIGDSQIIYTLEDVEFAILSAASYNDLRHKEVFWADWDTVSQIEVSLDGAEYTIYSILNESGRTWYYPALPEETADAEETTEAEDTSISILDFESALRSVEAVSFTEETPAGKEEIRLVLHLENENYPTVEISFYRYDGENCLAVVDGESVSLVERSLVIDLIEEINQIVL